MYLWGSWFHVATDIFLLMVVLYIILVLIEFRRKIYAPRHNDPHNEAEGNDNQNSHCGKTSQCTKV